MSDGRPKAVPGPVQPALVIALCLTPQPPLDTLSSLVGDINPGTMTRSHFAFPLPSPYASALCGWVLPPPPLLLLRQQVHATGPAGLELLKSTNLPQISLPTHSPPRPEGARGGVH